MSDKKTIIKDFQSMKPSVAFKQLDFSKLPKEVRDKIKLDLSQVSNDTLDLQFDQSTFKKWVETFSDLYPAAFGIKEEKKVTPVVVSAPADESFVSEGALAKVGELDGKIKDLKTRISIIKKMILKQPKKRVELKIRLKTVEKMIVKFEADLKIATAELKAKPKAKKKIIKKSIGGLLFGEGGDFISKHLSDLKNKRKKIRFDLGGTMQGNKKYKYSVTFQTITPESAEAGDYESQGFEVEETIDELQDILQDGVNRYGVSEPSSISYKDGVGKVSSGCWWSSSSPDNDRDYFEKGIEKYYSLHIRNIDGSELSDEEAQFVNDKLKEGRNLHWDDEENNWWREGGEIHSEDKDGILMFKADTKGGKYSIEVREGSNVHGTYYDIYEFTNGKSRGMGVQTNKELLMHKIIDTIIGSKKIDGINYIVSFDNINVKEYLPALEKIWDIYNSSEYREWFKKQNESLNEEQKQSLSDEIKNKTIKYVKDNDYKENDSTVGAFFNIFKKEKLIQDFYKSKGMVILKDGGSLKSEDRNFIKDELITLFGKKSDEYFFDKNEITVYSVASEVKVVRILNGLRNYNYEKNKKDTVDYQVVFTLSKSLKDGGGVATGFNVFNYTDNIYASPDTFKNEKEAKDFITQFRKRYEAQGYYKDNRLNKINPKDIDLEIIPEDFSPFKKGSEANVELQQGGTIDSDRRFTDSDFTKLTDSKKFDVRFDVRLWKITEAGRTSIVGKFNPKTKTLFIFGKKDNTNPLVKWLSENSFVSADEYDKLENGGGLEDDSNKKVVRIVYSYKSFKEDGIDIFRYLRSDTKYFTLDQTEAKVNKEKDLLIPILKAKHPHFLILTGYDADMNEKFSLELFSCFIFSKFGEKNNAAIKHCEEVLSRNYRRTYDGYKKFKEGGSVEGEFPFKVTALNKEGVRVDAGEYVSKSAANKYKNMIDPKHKPKVEDNIKLANVDEVGEWKSGSTINFKTKKEAVNRLDLIKNNNETDTKYRNVRVEKVNEEYVVRFESLKENKLANGGGLNSDNTPKVYIADLAAYNEGTSVGEWIDLSDFSSGEEVMDKIQELLAKWSEEQKVEREEYSVNDFENFPEKMYSDSMGEESFQKVIDYYEAVKDADYPTEVIEEYASQTGNDIADAVSNMNDAYQGKFSSSTDLAKNWVDSVGGIGGVKNPENYITVSDTDRRLVANEQADADIDNMDNEAIMDRADMRDEYDESVENEDDKKTERLLSEAKEIVHDEIYEEWYEGLNDPYNFLVEEQGIYDSSNIMNASFIMFDYDKFGEDLEQDYLSIDHDGETYYFLNS